MQEKKIGVEIKIIANLIGRNLNELYFNDCNISLTGVQGLVLGYLYDNQDEDVFQKDIEANFNIRRSTASGLLQSLEANGFIKRVSVDYDARLKKIILTDQAFVLRQELEGHLQHLETILTANLQSEEIEELLRIISKMKRNLE